MTSTPNPPIHLDFEVFAEAWWKIHDKEGRSVVFKPNPSQQLMLAKLKEQRKLGKPGRLRVLKYRQAGSSLLWRLYLMHQVLTRPGCTAISIADKLDLPAQWVRSCQSLLDQLEQQVEQPPRVKASSAHEIYLAEQNSRYHIGSAEGQTPGMGETLQAIHCSECASWHNPDTVLADLLPAVPPGPNTLVVQESTGRGVGDWWYQRYHEAKRGEDAEGNPCAYAAVFLPWFIQPEYTANGATWEGLGDLTEREQALRGDCEAFRASVAGLIGVPPISPGQIAWRRSQVVSEFHADEDLFANQYPANEYEAFLAGGQNIFKPPYPELARKTERKPIWRGDLLIQGRPDSFQLVENSGGDLLIFEHPDRRYHYVLGADCQWGVKDTSDFDVLYVECLETSRVCARMRGRFDTWAKYIAAVGFHYNTCPVAPERNAVAANTVMPLLLGNVAEWSYPAVWVRTDDVSLKGHRPQDYGWYTDEHSKGEIISFAKAATLSGSFDWADGLAIDEMEAYVRDEKSGKLTAPEGNFDDCLMARMITAYVAHRQRLRTELYTPPTPKLMPYRSAEERDEEMRTRADREMAENPDYGGEERNLPC